MTILQAPDGGPEASASSTDDHAALVGRLRATQASGVTRPLAWRRGQLAALRRLLVEREAELLEALRADLGKAATEAWATELRHVVNEIDHICDHLGGWVAPQRTPVRLLLRPARASVVAEPLGVVLVIAPWNYPVHLLLLPLAYALAAGNTVVAKPSEVAAATSAAIARLVPEYLDCDAVAVVEGDAPVVTSLLEQRFDHIFYTGNGRIGRVVMAAAAAHLTPVTLELGGKSPVIVDATANIAVAARRVAWGKFVNAGQTCVAPDYVLVDRTVEDAFVEALVGAVTAMYGADPSTSPDFGRIVNRGHVDRLAALLDGSADATVVTGGTVDRAARYVAPTILTGVDWEDAVMGEEIFGPVLPVIGVDDLDGAIAAVNAHDKPLALYVFTEDAGAAQRVIDETSSGGVCTNATLVHLAVTDLPFGGVGGSGMGAYHGRAGFETFSHRKAVLRTGTRLDPPLLYPPYTRRKTWLLRRTF